MSKLHEKTLKIITILRTIDDIIYQMSLITEDDDIEPKEKKTLLQKQADLIMAEQTKNPLFFFEALSKNFEDFVFEEPEDSILKEEQYEDIDFSWLLSIAITNNLFLLTKDLLENYEYFAEQEKYNLENHLSVTRNREIGKKTTISEIGLSSSLADLLNLPLDSEKNTLLHLAAKYNPEGDIVNLLLNKGADVNVQDRDFYTPLHSALFSKNINSLFLMMNQKIIPENHFLRLADIDSPEELDLLVFENLLNLVDNVDQVYDNGSALIHYITEGAFSTPILELLLDRNPDLNVRDAEGNTALHIASSPTGSPDLSVLTTLLDYGADPNAVDSDGNTPLHVIAMSRDTDKELRQIAKCLLKKGADINIKNHKGLNVIEAAGKTGHLTVSFLRPEKVNKTILKYPKTTLFFTGICAETPSYAHYIPIWQRKIASSTENQHKLTLDEIEETLNDTNEIESPDSTPKRRFDLDSVLSL